MTLHFTDSTRRRRDTDDSEDAEGNKKTLTVSPPRKFPAFLFVKADRNAYYAGETVSGSVYLLVNEAFPCSGVYLTLKVEERAWICEVSRHQEQNGEDIDFYNGKELLFDPSFRLLFYFSISMHHR